MGLWATSQKDIPVEGMTGRRSSKGDKEIGRRGAVFLMWTRMNLVMIVVEGFNQHVMGLEMMADRVLGKFVFVIQNLSVV